MRMVLLVTVLASLLAGCQAENWYVPLGGSPQPIGYTQMRLENDVYEVAYKGSGQMRYGIAKDMALLRAAEIGRKLGCSHFVVEGEQDATETRSTSYAFQVPQVSYIGGTVPITSYRPVHGSQLARFPRPVLRVQYHKGRPENEPLNVYETERVIADLCGAYKVVLSP
jgi:hypothetical protein